HAVRDLLAKYEIAGDRWELTVEPVPCLGWAGWRLPEITAWKDARGEALSLERIGVLHESTLRLTEDRATRPPMKRTTGQWADREDGPALRPLNVSDEWDFQWLFACHESRSADRLAASFKSRGHPWVASHGTTSAAPGW